MVDSTSFDLEDVVRLLNYTDQPMISKRITANRAGTQVREAMTDVTVMDPFLHLTNGFRQISCFFWRVLQYPKSKSKSRLLANAR
jgi:hypothetical protein